MIWSCLTIQTTVCSLTDNEAKPEPQATIQETAEAAKASAPPSPSDEFTKAIEEERKKKGALFDDLRRFKRRLAYKLAEKDAIAKFNATNAQNKKATKNIGYLRRKKESLEFRISTEAFTLDAEKDLIRKKQEVEEELQEAINNYRMKRKAEFVNSDIEELNKKIVETQTQLQELEKRLDVLYGGLRKRRGQQRDRKPHEHHQPPVQEVSFADIAVIKDKKEDKKSGG